MLHYAYYRLIILYNQLNYHYKRAPQAQAQPQAQLSQGAQTKAKPKAEAKAKANTCVQSNYMAKPKPTLVNNCSHVLINNHYIVTH